MSRVKRISLSALIVVVSYVIPPVEADEMKPSRTSGSSSQVASPERWQSEVQEGRRLLEVKDLSRAEGCFRRALQDLNSASHPSMTDRAQVMQYLARVLYMQDEAPESLALYKRSLHLLSKTYGERSEKLAPLYETIGDIFADEGDFLRARKYYQTALSRASGSLDKNACVELTTRIARAQEKRGQLREAEENYWSALKMVMTPDGSQSTDRIEQLLSDYISLLIRTESGGRVLQSAYQNELLKDRLSELPQRRAAPGSEFSSAVALQVKDSTEARGNDNADQVSPAPPSSTLPSPGPSSSTPPSSTPSLNPRIPSDSHADSNALEQINQQRIKFYERMIAADIDSLGAEHPSVARDLSTMASFLISLRRYDEARSLLLRALRIYRQIYDERSGPVRQTQLMLALLADEQDPATANIDLTYLQTLPRIPLQAQKLEVAFRLNELSYLMLCQGKIDQSLQTCIWGLASTARTSGDMSMLTAGNMIDLSRILRAKGHAPEAENLENSARSIVRRKMLERKSAYL